MGKAQRAHAAPGLTERFGICFGMGRLRFAHCGTRRSPPFSQADALERRAGTVPSSDNKKLTAGDAESAEGIGQTLPCVLCAPCG